MLSDEDAAGLIRSNLIVKAESGYRLNYFVKFVPARLDEQINQWVSGYLFQIVGYVVDELIRRGTLRKPDSDKPLTDGVFYVAGKYIDP